MDVHQRYSPRDPAVAQRVLATYATGLSGEATGKAVGVSMAVVWRVLSEAGVTRPAPCRGFGRVLRYVKRMERGGDYVLLKLPVGHAHLWAARPDRFVLEHRLVMALKLERRLEPHETVHHINGNTLDNRQENLQLRAGHHGPGVVHRCLDCGSSNVEAVEL